MAIDSRFIAATDLQQLFRDAAGNPLSAGRVYFMRDIARTVGKAAYAISGSPPNYTYVEITQTDLSGRKFIDLNIAGFFDDQVLFFPYEGTPDNSDGTIDLYYIVITDSSGDFLDPVTTREAQPLGIMATSTSQTVEINYIPNGQFLSHTNIPANPPLYVAGQIQQPITQIAYGGWTFERPNSSTARDIVTFERFGSPVENPTTYPRYSLRVQTEAASVGDSYKDVRIKFDDVNTFASTTQQYTFALTAKTNTGSNASLSLVLIKNYGTGGDTQTETTLTTFTITPTYTVQNYSFLFGNNDSKTIGTEDDDYLQLALRYPVDNISDISIDDIILSPGVVVNPAYPVTPERENQSLALTLPVPASDGSDVYLPIRLTTKGLEFDHSVIGKIYATSYATPNIGELLCDGSQYETSAYSTDGIPYVRLQQVLYDTGLNVPITGTGPQYFTGIINPFVTNELRIVNNTLGGVANASDVNTGFTIATIHGGGDYGTKAFLVASDQFLLEVVLPGTVTPTSAGTSGFAVSQYRIANNGISQVTLIQAGAASGLAGKYFTFQSIAAGGGTVNYYAWYQVAGSGVDPNPGGIGILIQLDSADNVDVVAQKTREALNGFQQTTVLTTAASSITPGSYFNINSSGSNFYVWYTVDGVGTDPAPAGRIGIKVDLASTMTNTQVAAQSQIRINQKYFATPDLRGAFLRGWDNGAGNDPNSTTRFSLVPGVIGDVIATYQFYDVQSHNHRISVSSSTGPSGAFLQAINSGAVFQESDYYGGDETRPYNAYVNYVIKY